MAKTSAGILLFRRQGGTIEVLLVHPGGPFWARKDDGSWSIPKGEPAPGENEILTAVREMEEETGIQVSGNMIELSPVKQQSGKVVHAWAVEGDADSNAIKSNLFSMEWPPRSGKEQQFPEIDQARWFTITEAKKKILKGQQPLLEELQSYFIDDFNHRSL